METKSVSISCDKLSHEQIKALADNASLTNLTLYNDQLGDDAGI